MSSTLANSRTIPKLASGDRLTRDEFERRYTAMTHVKKAELIDGEVYMPPAVTIDHAEPHAILIGCFIQYWFATLEVTVGDNATVRLDDRTEPQPDVSMFVRPEFGGRVAFVDSYIDGTPELVAEIATTTASIDLNRKMLAYQRNGVSEYIVWRTHDEAIDWFLLRDGLFVRQQPDEHGIHKSVAFPGLWLNVTALLQGDRQALLETLVRGIHSDEHARFINGLRQKRNEVGTP